MVEILKQHPGKVFRFEDAFETKSLVSELGIADRFSQNPPNVPTSQRSIQAVTYGQHPSHFILVVLCLGNPDPHNGYVICCYPKSRISPSQFMDMSKKTLTDATTVGAKVFWNASRDK
ncbi:hypothetical protein SBV1_340042 [Verrucomicrobia bacterium]|nr:hypothetical protein SBV1_340042 [Verrucomicrobiota bacterium]